MTSPPHEADTLTKLEIYKLDRAHVTALSSTIHGLPATYSTIIGGLWFGAASRPEWFFSAILLCMAAVVSGVGFVTVRRLREVLNCYLNRIQAFEVPHAFTIQNHRISIVKAQAIAFAITGFISILGLAFTSFSAVR